MGNMPIIDLKFTASVKSLKERGYTFQKLYAANYHTYRKQIDGTRYTIWFWVNGHTLEIEDWHQHTGNILEFYRNNLQKHIDDNKDLPIPSIFMKLKVHEESSEVSFKDMNEYYEHLMLFGEASHAGKSEKEKLQLIEEYNKKWEDYREVVINIETFDKILAEVEFLTK